jgi:hypothetical protein
MTRYKSNYDLTHPHTKNNAAITLASTTEDNFTVSGSNNEKYIAIFNYPSDSEVFVTINDTAAIPGAGTVTYPSTSMFKPKKLYVQAGDTVSLIASAAISMGVSLYRYE